MSKRKNILIYILIVIAVILTLHLFLSIKYFSASSQKQQQQQQRRKEHESDENNHHNNNNKRDHANIAHPVHQRQEIIGVHHHKSNNENEKQNHLIHLAPEDRDAVIRWVPRVNGAVYADKKFDPETIGRIYDQQKHEGHRINDENDPHHEVRRSSNQQKKNNKNTNNHQEHHQRDNNEKTSIDDTSCFWRTPMLNPVNHQRMDLLQKVKFRICPALKPASFRHIHNKKKDASSSSSALKPFSGTLALLHEIEKIGILEALQRDLDFEGSAHRAEEDQEQQQDNTDHKEENHNNNNKKKSSSSTQQHRPEIMVTTNDQLLLTASVFGSQNSIFEFVYDEIDSKTREEICDFTFDLLSHETLLGGGVKPDQETTDKESTASLLFEDETYSILIAPERKINIFANSVQGFHHAIRSFLLHAKENGELVLRTISSEDDENNNNNVKQANKDERVEHLFAVPCLEIHEDKPSMGWRSQHVDIARHFFSAETVLHSVVRPMAWAKMNILHLHLSDDQGWRTQSTIFPSLHLLGGRRESNLNGKAGSKKFVNSLSYDHNTGSQFWSVEDIWNFVQECRARGIRVMPEIYLPSHATAVLLALESEVLRFATQKEQKASFISAELLKRFQNRLKMRDRDKKISKQQHLFFSSSEDENENKNNNKDDVWKSNTNLKSSIEKEAILKAASGIERAASMFTSLLFSDSSSNNASSSSAITAFQTSQRKTWRRSFFGTLYHSNSDCYTAQHFEENTSPISKLINKIKKQQQQKKKSNSGDESSVSSSSLSTLLDEFLSLNKDWSSFEFTKDFFSHTSYDRLSDDNEKFVDTRNFIQEHSAVNCMGGTHGIVDPSQAAADVLTLVLSEVAYLFTSPLEYSSSSSSSSLSHKNKNKKQQHHSIISNTFGPTNLFHVGGDQASSLRDFSWSPWTLLTTIDNQNNNNNNIEAEVVQVKGDEENDAEARKKMMMMNSNKNKGVKGGLTLEIQRDILKSFPALLDTDNIFDATKTIITATTPSLQSSLTAHFINKLKDYSGDGHNQIRSAVWDETLMELHDSSCRPPPRGTIIIFWRDDGIPWSSISDVIVHMWEQESAMMKKASSNNHNANKKKPTIDSRNNNNNNIDNRKQLASEYYPLVFAGKTRLYFDYAQFEGGAARNKYWPLNTFGNWIPHAASTISRVFLVPELFPPEFLDFCSPIFQSEHRDKVEGHQQLFSYFSSKSLPGFRLVGVQGNLWSELLIKEEILRYQLFPRMFGVAEVGWSLCLSGIVPTVRMHLMKMLNDAEYKQLQEHQLRPAVMKNILNDVVVEREELNNFKDDTLDDEQKMKIILERKRQEAVRQEIARSVEHGFHHYDHQEQQHEGGEQDSSHHHHEKGVAANKENLNVDHHSHHFSCSMAHWMPSIKMQQMKQREEREAGQNFNDHDIREPDLLPVQEVRCSSFDMTQSPIMTSCTKQGKKKSSSSKKKKKQKNSDKDDDFPVFFNIWESKLMCSAQFEESGYY